MIKSYLKVAWRNIVRNKVFSIINILGLALGIASSLLIFLWVQDQRSMDAYHANADVLYKVMERQTYDGKIETGAYTPGPLADELKKHFPEIVHATGFSGWQNTMTFAVGNKNNKEFGCWAGADWFSMFSVPLLAGSPATALNGPNCLAISRKVAETYFASPAAALGKNIRLDNKKDYLVTAVYEDLPETSSIKYNFLLSWHDYIERYDWMKNWSNNGPQTIIQLRKDAKPELINTKIGPFLKKYNPNIGPSFDIQLFLHRFKDAYLYSNFRNGVQDGGRIEYVRLFAIIAIFLILIACINFMNLATARSVKRAREVGVRKVVGAMRGSLIRQFIGEALLFSFLALLLAVCIVNALMPAFNLLTAKQMQVPWANGGFWLVLLGITLLTGLIAGSYPALFLSALKPIRILKGPLKFGTGAKTFRRGLVVFQFVLSILLIVGTLIIYRQVNYVQSKNPGFERENLIYISAEGEVGNKFTTFKETLLQKPGIKSVSTSGEVPTQISSNTFGVHWKGEDPTAKVDYYQTAVGYDFVKTIGAEITGRDFSPAYGMDTLNYLINESAARRMGLKNPVGETMHLWDNPPGKIIGVIKDFHFQSLHSSIGPLILFLNTTPSGANILIKTQPGQTKQALASLESTWKEFNPAFPFTYSFASKEYLQYYESETVVASLANYFAILAIFISCMGLLGLSAFMAEQRTKEIGIRKTMGAGVSHVMLILSKDFMKLVFIAIIVASPLAWYIMNKWLENFVYHIDIEWWMFALAGALAIGIALITISFQTVKAALMNPVRSLRSE